MTDANDNEPWTEMCVRDLKLSLKAGNTIEEAASFLCRSGTIDDVRRKADELGADLAELKMAKVGRKSSCTTLHERCDY